MTGLIRRVCAKSLRLRVCELSGQRNTRSLSISVHRARAECLDGLLTQLLLFLHKTQILPSTTHSDFQKNGGNWFDSWTWMKTSRGAESNWASWESVKVFVSWSFFSQLCLQQPVSCLLVTQIITKMSRNAVKTSKTSKLQNFNLYVHYFQF